MGSLQPSFYARVPCSCAVAYIHVSERGAGLVNTASLDSASTELAPDERPSVRLVRAHDLPATTTKTTVDERPAPVSIAVLTNDAAFDAQLRAALDGAPTVATVATLDAAAALAAEHRCSILVTDLATTRSVLEALTHRLRAHDPAMVVVVAGDREQGAALIALQSAGVVDGFLLKPVTAAATQLVLEAATRRYRSHLTDGAWPTHRVRIRTHSELERPRVADDLDPGDTIDVKGKPRLHVEVVAPPLESKRKRSTLSRASWVLMTIVAMLAAGAAGFWISRRSSDLDTSAIIAKHLALAESALNAGRLLNPRDGAAHHFETALAIDPQNFTALRGLDAVARELSKRTQAYMKQQRFADAAVSLARLRELQPGYAELPLLDAQLEVLQDALVASHALQEATTATVPEQAVEAPRERDVPRSASQAPPAPSVENLSEPRSIRPTALAETETPPSVREIERGTEQQTSTAPELLWASITPLAVRPSEIPSTPAPPSEESQAPVATSPASTSASESDLPKLVTYVPPHYPSDAYARQMEGWVQISMEIAPNGAVLAPRVEAGEKRQLFGRAALMAVKQWKYEPDANRPAGKRSTVRVEFRLQ